MDVSIIIVNYNTRQMTSECIESIIKNTYNVNYEIILVDNGSQDGSKSYFENDKRIIYLYSEENLGFGKANNLGAKIASGNKLFFLNPDTILLNNAIAILSTYLDSNGNVGACGGNLYDANLNPCHSFRKFYPGIWWESIGFFDILIRNLTFNKSISQEHNYSDKPIPVAYITGADLMIKKDLFEYVGGFTPDFFMYFEETDLCFKISKTGKKIISVPSAKIQHLEGGSFDNSKINTARINRIENGRLTYYYLNCNNLTTHLCNLIHKLWLNYCYIRTKDVRYKEHIKFMKQNNSVLKSLIRK